MCIICYLPKGEDLTEKEFENCWDSNPHGGGIITCEKGQFFEHKSLEKGEFIEGALRQVAEHKEGRHLIHFRFANIGEKSVANLHPFKINEHLYMAHNGTIRGVGIENGLKESDTNQFAQKLAKLPFNFLQNTAIMDFVQDYVGTGNKLSFLTKSGVAFVNGASGEVDRGRWFSNTSFKTVRDRNTTPVVTPLHQQNQPWNQRSSTPPYNTNIPYTCRACGLIATYNTWNDKIKFCDMCSEVVYAMMSNFEMSEPDAAALFFGLLNEKEPPKLLGSPVVSEEKVTSVDLGRDEKVFLTPRPVHIPLDEWREFIRFTSVSLNEVPKGPIHVPSGNDYRFALI